MLSHNWLLKFWAALAKDWVCMSFLLPKCPHAPNHHVLTSYNGASCYCLANIDDAPRGLALDSPPSEPRTDGPKVHSKDWHLQYWRIGQNHLARSNHYKLFPSNVITPYCTQWNSQNMYSLYRSCRYQVIYYHSSATSNWHERKANAPRQQQWASYQEPRNPHDQGKCPSEGKPKCWFQSSTWVIGESAWINQLRW